jgi:tRNA G37 N-methylase TrmD
MLCESVFGHAGAGIYPYQHLADTGYTVNKQKQVYDYPYGGGLVL